MLIFLEHTSVERIKKYFRHICEIYSAAAFIYFIKTDALVRAQVIFS